MGKINPLYVSFILSLAAHYCLIGSGVFRIRNAEAWKPIEIELRAEREEYLPERYRVAREKKIEDPPSEEPAAALTSGSRESVLRYQDSVKQKIQREKRYPRSALRLGREGCAKVSFTLVTSGKIKDIRLLGPSGIGELDAEAVDAVKRAGPFSPFPDGAGAAEMGFELDMVFVIEKNPL